MTDAEVASETWLRAVFDEDARDDIFGDYAPTPDAPLLILLGGQPASGKSRAQEAIFTAHPDAQLVPVTGDELREYHPDYPRLARTAPLEMPGATAPVSGGLVRLALDHAIEHRYSVLLEGTFRDTAMVTGTTARFAKAGYRVEVVAVATPAPISRLSAEQRALGDQAGDFGRWTPPEAHESALARSPEVLAALEASEFVARVQVHSRDRLLYDNTRTPDGAWEHLPAAAEVLRAEQTRQPDPAQAADWLIRYQAIFDVARARPGYLGPATGPAYRRLEQDAAAYISIAATDPAVDTAALRREQRARRATLRRLGLTPTRGLLDRLIGGDDPGTAGG